MASCSIDRLKKELDELAEKHEQFNVHYFLGKPPEGWQGGKGFITKEAIDEYLPKPKHDSKILMCGECQHAVRGVAEMYTRRLTPRPSLCVSRPTANDRRLQEAPR